MTAGPDNMAPSLRSGPADVGMLGSRDPHVYRPSLVLLQCLLLELYLTKNIRNKTFQVCYNDKLTIKLLNIEWKKTI